MKRLNLSISALVFFGLAIAAWFGQNDPLECGFKALCGAGVFFVLLQIATKIVIGILASAMVGRAPANVKDDAGARNK